MSWENLLLPYANNKGADQSAQSDQRLYCSLPAYYNTSSFYIRNFKPLASFCGCTGQFVSYLVENPEAVFSWWGSYSVEPDHCSSDYLGSLQYTPLIAIFEPLHDKTKKMSVRPAKTLIRCPGWSESSLGAHAIFVGFVMRRLILTAVPWQKPDNV